MKIRYIVIIIILLLLFGYSAYNIYITNYDDFSRIDRIIQISGILIALITAIIALSNADKKYKKIKTEISIAIDSSHTCSYKKGDLSPELNDYFNKFPDPIKSARVNFKITNKSGFTLSKPTFSFKLPEALQHPNTKHLDIFIDRAFRSNLFNSKQEFRYLEFGDQLILSNSNLPFLNNEADITIWIRMIINYLEPTSLPIEVSINCENAEGITKSFDFKDQMTRA